VDVQGEYIKKILVGEVSPWGPANRRIVGAYNHTPFFIFSPVIWTHTPSLAPDLLWFAGGRSGWRCDGGCSNYYSVEEDNNYRRRIDPTQAIEIFLIFFYRREAAYH
jgi:hypothetical protein